MTWNSTFRRGEANAFIGLVAAFVISISGNLASAEAPVVTPDTILISAGTFITGSDHAEREVAYQLDEAAYGHSATRKNRWYEGEEDRRGISLAAFRITTNLVRNADYARFIRATGRAAPNVSRETWSGYGLVHPFERTRRHAWAQEAPPDGRAQHPVVLVSHGDALAYAAWLSAETGIAWRLPRENEWEKASRGVDGRMFPWGDTFDAAQLNSHDAGPFDTMDVGSFPAGASPFGMMDPAGQVFEWTSTPAGKGRWIVKGGSWDDKGCGVCRPAARHSRPEAIKHILIGFRLVRDVD